MVARMRKRSLSLGLLVCIATPAFAQEGGQEAAPTEGAPAEATPAAEPEGGDAALQARTVKWGVGARLRYVFMPRSILNLFVDQSQPMSSVGFGAQLVRRKGDFDVIFALEYEGVAADEGFWTENGGNPSQGDTDYVTFDGFALLGLDVGFVWHKSLHPRVDLRYGAGVGLGFVLGDYTQIDASCPGITDTGNVNDSTCTRLPTSETNKNKPPVVPIVNVLIGARIKANDQISINVEFGFRDMFFLGVGSDYIF